MKFPWYSRRGNCVLHNPGCSVSFLVKVNITTESEAVNKVSDSGSLSVLMRNKQSLNH